MDEFHHFARTNAWISEVLRKKHETIYAVAPITAAPILASVDFIVTDSKETGELYPNILRIMDKSRNVFAYKTTNIYSKAMKYFSNINIEKFYMYTNTESDHAELNELFHGNVELCLSPGIPSDFRLIGKYIESGGSITPFTEDLEHVHEILPNIKSNTICILTRNFQEKQKFYNTKKKDLVKFVNKANNNGFNVVNLGSPLLSLKVNADNYFKKILSLTHKKRHDSYVEISGLNYSQTLAIAVSSLAWQIVPHAGGFGIHIASKANLIIAGPEFCKTDKGEFLFDIRKRRSDLETYGSLRDFLNNFQIGNSNRASTESTPRLGRVIDLEG